jgi:hypothetical protein
VTRIRAEKCSTPPGAPILERVPSRSGLRTARYTARRVRPADRRRRRDAINKLIKYIRKKYPPLLTVAQYCEIRNCCQAKAYEEFKKYRGLAVKDGRSTRVNLEFTIDIIANLPEWVPEKERDEVALDIIANLPPWVPEKERVDEKEKPYERSRRRAETVSSPSDAVKPLPAPSAPAVKPRRERRKRVTAAPAPAATARPERPAPAEPQSHLRDEPARRVSAANTASTNTVGVLPRLDPCLLRRTWPASCGCAPSCGRRKAVWRRGGGCESRLPCGGLRRRRGLRGPARAFSGRLPVSGIGAT